MWRVSIRNLLGHKMRLAATGLAIMIGVAFLTGTLVFKDTMQRTFDDMFAQVYEDTDAVVRSAEEFDDPSGFGVQRGRVSDSLLAAVRSADGVAAAQGDVIGYTQLVDRDGRAVGHPQNGPPTIGGNWGPVDELNPWNLIAGRAPRADDEVVIDSKLAEITGYRVGDTAQVLVLGPPQTVRIAGIAEFGEGASTGGATFVLFTTAAAQRLVAQPGTFDTISVVADPGVSETALVRNLDAVLPDRTEAVTGAVITQENQDAVQRGMSVFNTFMLVFAFVALFVGAFIVFNTFFITVTQRTRQNALLRAIGASRGQILRSVMLEALGVGLLSSVIGMGGGVVVAALLKALLVALGFDLPVSGIVFTTATAVTALIAGTVLTLGAALAPARRAGRVPPVVAMAAVAPGASGYGSVRRIAAGAALLVIGIGSLLYGLFGDVDNALPVVGLAAVVVFLGMAVLGRTLALPLSRLIGWPLPRVRGIAGELARENAMRNPQRTAATASALMIGVGLVSFITIFASSTKASIAEAIDQRFLGDFVITSPAMAGMGGLDPGLGDRLDHLPEVDIAGGVRVKAALVDGTPTQLFAADPEAFQIFDVRPLRGTPADLGPHSIAVFEDVADDKHLAIGDTVPVVFTHTGLQQLRVGMIYGENSPAGNWLLGIDAYEANVADQYDFQVFVRKTDGVTSAKAMTAVQQVVDEYPGASLLDQTGYKAEQSKFVDQLLGLIYALLGLAILIALLGIGNTLALSILERIRELGVLRAVGMTRGQVRSAVRWEAVIIAVQGTLLGIAVGLFFGWALVSALGAEGVTTFAVPFPSLAVVVILGNLAGVAASVLPARRAAKIDVLRALAAG